MLATATEDLRALVSLGVANAAPVLIASQVLAMHEKQQRECGQDATLDAMKGYFEFADRRPGAPASI